MKKLIALLLAATSFAVAADPEPSRPFELAYDYDALTPIRLYADGALLKEYAPAEIMWLGKATQSGFTNTYAVTVPALNRAEATLTAAALVSNGTNWIESAASEPLRLEFRPRALGMLQPLNLVNDDDAIIRIVQAATRAAMIKHPLWRTQFEGALAQMDTLSHATVIDAGAILAIVKRYPLEELNGEARLLLRQFERGDALDTRAVVVALLTGLRAGLNTPAK